MTTELLTIQPNHALQYLFWLVLISLIVFEFIHLFAIRKFRLQLGRLYWNTCLRLILIVGLVGSPWFVIASFLLLVVPKINTAAYTLNVINAVLYPILALVAIIRSKQLERQLSFDRATKELYIPLISGAIAIGCLVFIFLIQK